MNMEKEIITLVADVDKAIRPLLAHVNLEEISKYNKGYELYKADKFKYFVEWEKNRFSDAIRTVLAKRSGGNVCDLGCFIPYLPIALSRLGYKVKMVDKYEFYGQDFRKAIFELAAREGIEIYDLDILKDDFRVLKENDVVLLLAVVEHLSGSPKHLMKKVREILREDGLLLFDVPNIVEFSKRLRVLLGRSPLSDYGSYFESTYPYIGHNREMTVSEVRFLLESSGFRVDSLRCWDSGVPGGSVRDRLVQLFKKLVPFANIGQTITAMAVPGIRKDSLSK